MTFAISANIIFRHSEQLLAYASASITKASEQLLAYASASICLHARSPSLQPLAFASASICLHARSPSLQPLAYASASITKFGWSCSLPDGEHLAVFACHRMCALSGAKWGGATRTPSTPRDVSPSATLCLGRRAPSPSG